MFWPSVVTSTRRSWQILLFTSWNLYCRKLQQGPNQGQWYAIRYNTHIPCPD